MNLDTELNKSTVIGNIQIMQGKIGINIYSYETLIKESYDELHERQNGLIAHYNEAVKNGNQSQTK